jgi:hypothetical protein
MQRLEKNSGTFARTSLDFTRTFGMLPGVEEMNTEIKIDGPVSDGVSLPSHRR